MSDNKKEKRAWGLGVYINISLSVIFSLSAAYLIYTLHASERDEAFREAEARAQLLLEHNLAIHTYFSQALKPSVFKLIDSAALKDYFEPAWMSSTYAVREIDKRFKSFNNAQYYYKECAINARSPENEADAFERAFIQELNANPELKYRSLIQNIGGKFYYVILRRGEMMEESCLRCHSTPLKSPGNLVAQYGPDRSFQRRLNEVVSAISIRVPVSAPYAQADQMSWRLSKIFLAVFVLLFAMQYLLHQVLVIRPISALRDQAIRISQDERRLGQEISLSGSGEFQELASAFNTMSQKLRQQMDQLEDIVAQRTSNLQTANEKLLKALDEIKTIKGIIPICMYCKEIRDDKGAWNQLEQYISEHSDAQFSHGICEKCLKKYHPQVKI